MKNLEQMLKAFLKRKDLLDSDGTKSGGVPHIQLSESIKIDTPNEGIYYLDGFYLGGDKVFLLLTDPNWDIICPSYPEAFITFSTFFLIQLRETLYQAMVQILWEKHYGNTKI